MSGGVRQQFRSLGALLMEKGLLTPERLEEALLEQKRTGGRLGRILVARGWVRERDIHLVLDGMMVVVFRLGASDFGIETLLVREIVRHEAPRPVPGAPDWLAGVRDYRGRAIPVVDLASRLGLRPSGPPGPAARSIVYEGPGGRLWGLTVDSVSAVTQVSSERLEERAEAVDCGLDPAWVGAVARLDQGPVAVLNMDALLGGDAEELRGAR